MGLGESHLETLGTMLGLARLLCEQGRPEEAEPLFKRSAAGYEGMGDEGAPLVLYAQEGSAVAIAFMVLLAGADVDKPVAGGCTPLIAAAAFGHTEAVEALLSLGADASLVCKENSILGMGGTAAEIAERKGFSELAAKLRGETPRSRHAGTGAPGGS